MEFHELGYPALALSAYLSATLLPGASELLLLAMITSEAFNPILCVVIATLGNTAGGMTTFYMGRLALLNNTVKEQLNKINPTQQNLIHQWGPSCLLLSWAPIIGDGLCLAAGVFRLNSKAVVLYMLAGKLLRYLAIMYLGLNMFGGDENPV